MTTELTVNSRWILKSPAMRGRALREVESALEGAAITWSVEDSPDLGALGLPIWTVFVFHAQHGDPDRLDRDVELRLSGHNELALYLEKLTVE
jgi:hypothetical protein